MQGFAAITQFHLPLAKNTSKTWGPLGRHHAHTHAHPHTRTDTRAHTRTHTHAHAHTHTRSTHLLSLTLQEARITSLMQPSRKTIPSPAKMKLKGVQQPVESSHCVQNKICKAPKSSSPLKRTVSKQLTYPTAQNGSSVISKWITVPRNKSAPIEIPTYIHSRSNLNYYVIRNIFILSSHLQADISSVPFSYSKPTNSTVTTEPKRVRSFRSKLN